MIKGFKDFILRGNVVDLAVAVIIGGAFGAIVKSLVEDVITPLIGKVVGTPDFSDIKIADSIMIGKFLNATISFLLVAFAVYFMIVMPLKKLQDMRKKQEIAAPAAPPATPDDVVLLREIRDLLQRQQK